MAAAPVAVTGASGLIGSALVRSLQADGVRVVRLVRRPPSAPDEAQWDPSTGKVDLDALAGVGAVVHLAGAGVADRPWTPAYRRTVLESRTRGTAAIATACAGLDPQPALVSGSAVGLYGDAGDRVLHESSARGTGFLSDVVHGWEAAAQPAVDAGVRVTFARTGLVVSAKGGAFGRLLPAARLGLLPRFGDGRQWWSLISLEDEVRALRFLAEHSETRGAYNLAAVPARVEEVLDGLRSLHRRGLQLPVPAAVLRRLTGEMSTVLLDSQRVVPTRLTDAGFTFRHASVADVLATTRP